MNAAARSRKVGAAAGVRRDRGAGCADIRRSDFPNLGSRRRRFFQTLEIALGAAALLALAACRRGAAPAPEEPAAPLAVAVSLDKAEIRIGEPVRVELTVTHPAGGTLDLPEPAPIFEVRSRETRAESAGPSRARHRALYDLTAFEIGVHTVFTNRVAWLAPDGARLEADAPATNLTVRSTLEEGGGKPRDLKPPLPWPPALPRWLWAIPAVILAATAAALLIRGWLRRRERRPPLPPPPPHEIALAELARLRERGWIEAGAAEPFFIEVSRIVRAYIEARFGLRAPEQTTEEFLRAAAESAALSPEHRALAAEFLTQCDLVKFARAQPGADAMRGALAAAERLVRETIPAAPPTAAAGVSAAAVRPDGRAAS